MQRVGVQCSGSRFPSSVLSVSPHDGCPICVCRQGLYREAHSPLVTDTVHATKQHCRGSLRHYISWVLQSPLSRDSPLHDGECGKHSAISPSRCLGHFHRSCRYLFPHTHPQRLPKCLRFQTRDTIYQFQALLFGLSPAPWVFTMIMKEIKMLVYVMGINLCQYPDDWRIYSPSHDQCLRDTVQVLNLCHTMDLLIDDKKSELIPKQKFLFSGIPVRPGFLPGHSNSGSVSQIKHSFLLSQGGCAYAWQILLGLCVHRKNGSFGMAAHQQSPTLHLSTLGFQCFNQQFVDTSFPHGGGRFPMVEISTQCSEGSPSYPDKTDTRLFTDALNIGWGAHWNALTVSGVWTTTEKTLHTNVLELEAIHRAMIHWLRKLMGLTVLGASDNSIVVSYIIKQGGTRSIQLCRWTKKLLLMCQANQIVLQAQPITGRLNVLADILSRPSQMSGTEWSPHSSVFQALTRGWGIPLLDLFAMRWNHKLPLFVSPVPDPSAMAVGALSMSWKALWAYVYPPPALLPRVLEKAEQDQYELILIAPHWPQAIWFPLLLGMLVQSPLWIPNTPRLLSQP